MYFLCDVLWVCKDIVESIYNAVERGSFRVFEDFSIDFFGALIIELLVFRYGFFYLFVGIVGGDFAGFVFSFFGDIC